MRLTWRRPSASGRLSRTPFLLGSDMPISSLPESESQNRSSKSPPPSRSRPRWQSLRRWVCCYFIVIVVRANRTRDVPTAPLTHGAQQTRSGTVKHTSSTSGSVPVYRGQLPCFSPMLPPPLVSGTSCSSLVFHKDSVTCRPAHVAPVAATPSSHQPCYASSPEEPSPVSRTLWPDSEADAASAATTSPVVTVVMDVPLSFEGTTVAETSSNDYWTWAVHGGRA